MIVAEQTITRAEPQGTNKLYGLNPSKSLTPGLCFLRFVERFVRVNLCSLLVSLNKIGIVVKELKHLYAFLL